MIIDNLNRYGFAFHSSKTHPQMIRGRNSFRGRTIVARRFQPVPRAYSHASTGGRKRNRLSEKSLRPFRLRDCFSLRGCRRTDTARAGSAVLRLAFAAECVTHLSTEFDRSDQRL